MRSNSSAIVICYFFGGVFISLVGYSKSVSPLWNWEGSRSTSCRAHRGFIPLFILSSLAAFLPILSFITFLWSIYHRFGTAYKLSLEIQGKPDIFPHSRRFHRRGDKILRPLICWISFWWRPRGVCWWVNSYRQSPILPKQFWDTHPGNSLGPGLPSKDLCPDKRKRWFFTSWDKSEIILYTVLDTVYPILLIHLCSGGEMLN